MRLSSLLASAPMLLAATVAANAATALQAGYYSSVGVVESANSACAAVNLTAGANNLSEIYYPGAGKTGFALYVPLGVALQSCSGFAAVPTTGLTNWSPAAVTCNVNTAGGATPGTVSFTFQSTVVDKNSSVGATTVSITSGLGAGCTAQIATTLVYTGK